MSAGPPERAVESANAALYAAVESADLDLMEAVWLDGSEGSGVVCVHPGWEPLRGRAEVLRSWAAIMAATDYVQFFLTDVDVRVTGDTAVVSCTENVLAGVDDPEGAPAGFRGSRAVATNVFRRTPSGWRLWVHHASPVAVRAPEDAGEDSPGEEAPS